MKTCLCAVSALLLVGTSNLSAEPRRAALSKGMATRDVVTRWGEPQEIQEQEAKRLEVWYYSKGDRVVVREGRVVDWSQTGAPNILPASAPQASTDTEVMVGKRKADAEEVLPPVMGSTDTRDLVREIAKELPSGPDLPYTESPESNNPQGVPPAAAVPVQPPQNSLYANPPVGFQPYVTNDMD